MEASRAASHVEFFAKACTAMLEVRENGRYRVERTGNDYSHVPCNAYYFGHLLKCNFFFANSIGNLHFPPKSSTGKSSWFDSRERRGIVDHQDQPFPVR